MFEWLDSYSKTISIYNGRISKQYHQKLKTLFKILEWTGHGIPWLIFAPAMAFFSTENEKDSRILFITITIALLFDLLVICCLKLLFKRSRPKYNEDDMPLSASKIDSFSFPSGHTTRAFMLAYIFLYWGYFQILYTVLITLWAFILGFSRIALGRHHVTDVIAGVIIGLLQGAVLLSDCMSSAIQKLG